MMRGAAGLVTDGGLRDTPEISDFEIPTYIGAPSAPTNLIKHHAVETLNEPIGCGGVAVYPGDIVVGDLEGVRSEEHTSELQSLMRISYAVFCLKKKKKTKTQAS